MSSFFSNSPHPQTFEKMIVEHIKDIFDILPEQLVLVEMVEKTSELIIEIIG